MSRLGTDVELDKEVETVGLCDLDILTEVSIDVVTDVVIVLQRGVAGPMEICETLACVIGLVPV